VCGGRSAVPRLSPPNHGGLGTQWAPGRLRIRGAAALESRAARQRRRLRAGGVRGAAAVSTAIGFSPTAAIGSPHRWPCFLPAGGHWFSPAGGVRDHRRGAERVARGGASMVAARTVRPGASPPSRRSLARACRSRCRL
jgi:hypothetical protein